MLRLGTRPVVIDPSTIVSDGGIFPTRDPFNEAHQIRPLIDPWCVGSHGTATLVIQKAEKMLNSYPIGSILRAGHSMPEVLVNTLMVSGQREAWSLSGAQGGQVTGTSAARGRLVEQTQRPWNVLSGASPAH